MTWDADAVTMLSWEALGIVWLIGLAFTKRTVKAQPDATRVFQMAVILLGYCLLGLGSNWLQSGWLGMRYLPVNFAFREAGAALTLAGCLFAIWARITLGGNWSGRATVKEGHELIVKGPYAIARHPIYTGLLLASVGTALAIGQWRCILGLFDYCDDVPGEDEPGGAADDGDVPGCVSGLPAAGEGADPGSVLKDGAKEPGDESAGRGPTAALMVAHSHAICKTDRDGSSFSDSGAGAGSGFPVVRAP